ncbi:hypothetical protein F441_20629 [Phytophthora nicotianae CJ01A1]|uniref:Uncharacterized protein n=3 Tax=Phytophthora nicotianae TaxID=4792 RepID=V9DTL4_PHYNI|nr:hypothetical protein F443_22682 [Phytophthora nicotianae P1569]ETK75684.1 hypothetical protein L915_17746 [Phytophthora nicotianae]ETP02284.1 hypothetical protein F441_20629 [Phytophthora nicotianae CJ01A1]ETL29116.1 hypothetical protein L916_17646 [Phytophthora nicotianae]ETL82340.1 hypothetical protein L917_17485 [Phytophthora nicotianae]
MPDDGDEATEETDEDPSALNSTMDTGFTGELTDAMDTATLRTVIRRRILTFVEQFLPLGSAQWEKAQYAYNRNLPAGSLSIGEPFGLTHTSRLQVEPPRSSMLHFNQSKAYRQANARTVTRL